MLAKGFEEVEALLEGTGRRCAGRCAGGSTARPTATATTRGSLSSATGRFASRSPGCVGRRARRSPSRRGSSLRRRIPCGGDVWWSRPWPGRAPATAAGGTSPPQTRRAQNAGRNRRRGACQILPTSALDGVFGKDRSIGTAVLRRTRSYTDRCCLAMISFV